MTTIMTRSGAKFWWGKDLPKEVAYLTNDVYGFGAKPEWKAVLKAEIKERKISVQQNAIEYKARSKQIKPAYIWVFYNDPKNQSFFTGWYVYIKTLKKDYAINFRVSDTYQKYWIEKLMQLVPVSLFQIEIEFDIWAENFAKKYNHSGFGRRKNQGLLPCWILIDEQDRIEDIQLERSLIC